MLGRDKKSRQNKEFAAEASRHLDRLYSTALRLTGQPADAEDLVHDTFVRAMRFRHRFEPGTNMRAWLFRMMVNLFINEYRRRRRGSDIHNGPEQQELLARNYDAERLRSSVSPEEYFFEKLFSEDVVTALGRLPIDFRLLVLLVDIEEFSYSEVAHILDIPVGTVMSRLHRGRRLLRAELYEYALREGYLKPDAEQAEARPPADLAAYRRRKEEKC